MFRYYEDFHNIWLIPKKPTVIWTTASYLTIFLVGTFSKSLVLLNKVKVHNQKRLFRCLEKRPKGQGLITVSNHYSCIDDPFIWGTLKYRHMLNDAMRWTLAANDICFNSYWASLFFCLGKVPPVVRGKGVYQHSVDFIIQQMNCGQWSHIFPEGKVNMQREFMRLKWGVGRIVADSEKTPIVLPLYHIGIQDVLPNSRPYFPRFNKKVTVLVGEPIDFSNVLESMKSKKMSPMEIRKYITDIIQDELMILKEATRKLHNNELESR